MIRAKPKPLLQPPAVLLRDRWALLCILVVTLPWWMALGFGFIALDDGVYAMQNPEVLAGLHLQGIGWAFTTGFGSFWLPLTWLSLMLDTTLFGSAPLGYHLTNVALHIANTLLVYFFLKQATRAPGRSLVAALLFAMHPLRVESVAWVTERKDVLFTFFGLWALIAYVRYARTGSWRYYALMLVAYACSLMSKSTLVTMPAVLLLLDFWPLNRRPAVRFLRLVAEKIPVAVLAIAIAAVTLVIQQNTDALVPRDQLPMDFRVENMIVSYAFYLRDCIYFADLSLFYPLPQTIADTQLGVSLLLLLALSAPAAMGVRWRPARPFLVGWLWFLITLFPMMGLVQSGLQARADRFTYFPAIGLTAGLVFSCPEQWLAAANARRAALFAGALVLALSVYCTMQLWLWREPLALYQNSIAHAGDSEMIESAIAWELERTGNADTALEYYFKALALNPNLGAAHNNVGMILLKRGQTREAYLHFKTATLAMPHNAQMRENLRLAEEALARESATQP